jgi:hypothetical protein
MAGGSPWAITFAGVAIAMPSNAEATKFARRLDILRVKSPFRLGNPTMQVTSLLQQPTLQSFKARAAALVRRVQ